jgi:hypothetical protein
MRKNSFKGVPAALIAAAAPTKPIYGSKVRHGYDAFRGAHRRA